MCPAYDFGLSMEARRGNKIPWNSSHRLLSVAMWLLGIEPRSFGRAVSTLNHWAISLALSILTFWHKSIQYKGWGLSPVVKHFPVKPKALDSVYLWEIDTGSWIDRQVDRPANREDNRFFFSNYILSLCGDVLSLMSPKSSCDIICTNIEDTHKQQKPLCVTRWLNATETFIEMYYTRSSRQPRWFHDKVSSSRELTVIAQCWLPLTSAVVSFLSVVVKPMRVHHKLWRLCWTSESLQMRGQSPLSRYFWGVFLFPSFFPLHPSHLLT